MGIPVLKLNLAPPPTLWRQNHETLGLLALALGAVGLILVSGISVRKYLQASREGKRMVSISTEGQRVAREQARVAESLRRIDPVERTPRYRLAERIFLERTLPWSRLTAELERCMVQDARVKSIQRVRANDGTVLLKVRGEARSREAEVNFVEALQENGMFAQVVLEREGERQGGGIEFDLALPVAVNPPAYEPLPVQPPVVVDQFGKPLTKDAKVLGVLSGGSTSPGARPAAPPQATPPQPPRPPAVQPPRPAPVQPAAPANTGNEPPFPIRRPLRENRPERPQNAPPGGNSRPNPNDEDNFRGGNRGGAA